MDEDEVEQIYLSCIRFLRPHYPQTPQQVFSDLAETTEPGIQADHYGEGKLISDFEQKVATLLGKEAAVFMPSGTMCQQIVLRIYAERSGIANIAFHPTCHLEIHEQKGYERLHHLHGIHVGSAERLMTLDDLKAIAEPVSALLIELPQREIGGQLPTWEELMAIIEWAREHHIPTHMDGARLWECQPYYQRPYAEIAALFNTVYVSFYKGLGGITGAILAGAKDIIAEARVWQRRHGGNLIHLYPYVISAKKGLNERLGRMEIYHSKAKEIAATLLELPQIEVKPNPPQTNMMHLFLRGNIDKLNAAGLAVAKETKVWLFPRLSPTSVPNHQKLELSVGEATLDLSLEEIVELFHMLFEKAGV